MNGLDKSIKEKIVECIEFILQPIDGRVISFEEAMELCSSDGNIVSANGVISVSDKIITYPVRIKSKVGEIELWIRSNYLHSIRLAVEAAYNYASSSVKDMIPFEISLEIMKKISDSYNQDDKK